MRNQHQMNESLSVTTRYSRVKNLKNKLFINDPSLIEIRYAAYEPCLSELPSCTNAASEVIVGCYM